VGPPKAVIAGANVQTPAPTPFMPALFFRMMCGHRGDDCEEVGASPPGRRGREGDTSGNLSVRKRVCGWARIPRFAAIDRVLACPRGA